MNILFLLKSCDIGGVEVVTTVLANKFKVEGHQVVLWTFYEGETSLKDRLRDDIPVICGCGFKASQDNVISLRRCLNEYKINIVINQWGLPFIPIYNLKKASKGMNLKIISVYHNDPPTNGKLKEIEIDLEKHPSFLKLSFLKGKYWLYRQVTSASMRYVYRNSDVYMVLSPSFVEGFKRFTGLKDVSKLVVQTNPVTIDTSRSTECFAHKEKEILFVGRLDDTQKRVSRVIETWALLESKYPDWHLSIVGDGPAREDLFGLTKTLGLEHVSFEGFQNPRPYYERASLLVLSSEFEGFGLVIVEGMCFGVVPVVLGSYSAIYDILENGKDGIIVPYDKQEGFKAGRMAEELKRLMDEPERKLEEMRMAAYNKSRRFSLDSISDEWRSVLGKLDGLGGGKTTSNI